MGKGEGGTGMGNRVKGERGKGEEFCFRLYSLDLDFCAKSFRGQRSEIASRTSMRDFFFVIVD
jgi:hypothetical protein